MAQITLSGSIGHFNPVLSIIDILDAQGGMRTIPTFTNGALNTEFAGIPNKIKQYVSTITVTDTNSIYYLTGLTATNTGSWTPLVPISISSLNGLTAPVQTFATGTAGTNFTINSIGSTHTFNIPNAGLGVSRGLITNGTQTIYGAKTFNNGRLLLSCTNNSAETSSIEGTTNGFYFRNRETLSLYHYLANGRHVMWNAAGTFYGNLETSFYTADRTHTLPDASGTLALVSNIGVYSLNGLITSDQVFATGTTGTDFTINSIGSTHTFNIPNASTTARGVVTINDQSFSGFKTFTDNIAVNTIRLWRGSNNSASNIGIGFNTLRNNTGNENTIIGYQAVSATATSSSFTTAVGYQALRNVTGNNNTAFGNEAGMGLTGGSQNTFIGAGAGSTSSQLATVQNSTAIGYNAFTTKNNQVVLGNSSIVETVLNGSIIIDPPATSNTPYVILTRDTANGFIKSVSSSSAQGPQGFQGFQGIQGNKGGLQYTFNAGSTGSGTSTGKFNVDATLASSVTAVWINSTTSDGAFMLNYLNSYSDNNNSGGYMIIQSNTNGDSTSCVLKIASSGYAVSTEVYYAVTYLSGTLPSNLENCTINFSKTGPPGVDGANSLRWFAGTNGISSISGPLVFDHNSDSFSAITTILISTTDSNAVNVGAWLQDINTSVANGLVIRLQIHDTTDNSVFGTYTVTSTTSAGLPSTGSYLVANLTYLVGNGTIVAGREYSISWTASGVKGPQGVPGYSTGLVYYFNNNLPNQGAGSIVFRDLDRTISIGATTSISNTLTSSTPVLFGSFITPDNEPLITDINGGTWSFEMWATTSSSSIGDHGIYARVYSYHLDTSTTLISSSTPAQVLIIPNSLPNSYVWTIPIAPTTILDTDRILIELYGVANSTPFSKTLTMYFNNGTIGQVQTTLSPFGAGPQGPAGPNNLSGTPNYIAKFTGASSIGDSNISDTGTGVGGGILINVGGTSSVRVNSPLTIGNTTFPAGGNTFLSISRAQSSIGFYLGNPDTAQVSALNFNNYVGSAVNSNAYLQIGASSGVYFTAGDTLSSTTTYQDNLGRWGFGTTATSFARLNVLMPAITGRESVMSVQVSDNTDDRYILGNGTTTSGRFIPTHVGFAGGTYSSLIFRGLGLAASDSGTEPYVQFRSAITSSSTDPNNGTLSNSVTRPLFTFGSVNESMRILANGNIGINTTLPIAKLHTAAIDNVAMFEYTNPTGLSAGDNFTFNSLILGDDISLQATRGLNTTRIIGYNGAGQSYFNDGAIISYPNKDIRMNGQTTFAKTITYELPNTPTVATGEIVYFGLSSIALVAGDIYYYADNEEWKPADVTAYGNKLLGIPLGTTVSSGILIKGFAKFSGNSNYSGFVNNGARQYINSTPGSFSEIAPAGSGETVRIIGYCVNTDTLYFSPDTTWVEIL